MTKIKQHKKGTVKPMPPFKTLEEEAEYWDTHSVVEGVTDNTVVGFHKAKKTEVLPIRFAPEDLSKLREQADEQGMGPTTLARTWILRHLRASSGSY